MNALHKHFDRLRELLGDQAEELITQYRTDAAQDSRDSRKRIKDRRDRYHLKKTQAAEIAELARAYLDAELHGAWYIDVNMSDLPLDPDDDGETEVHMLCWQDRRQVELIYSRSDQAVVFKIIRDSDDEQEENKETP